MAKEWSKTRKFNGKEFVLRRVGSKKEILSAQKRWRARNDIKVSTRVLSSKMMKKNPNFSESGRYALYVRTTRS